jgi:hypothetical protein
MRAWIMEEFMISLRGYDIAQVREIIAKGEDAIASDDVTLRQAAREELSSVNLRRRIRGYAPHQVERAISDIVAQLN